MRQEEAQGVCFSVVGAEGEVREREICHGEPEAVLRYLLRYAAARGLVGAAWRYGPLHGWQAGGRAPGGGAAARCGVTWVPQPLLCPEFRRVQGLAYRRLAGFLTAREGPAEARARLGRLCGYFADVDAGVRSMVVHEIAPALPNLVRFVDTRAIVRELLGARAIEVLRLPPAPEGDEALPPGVFLLRSSRMG